MPEEIRFLGDLQRLAVKPGDRFVLVVQKPVSAETAARIQFAWERFIGDGEKVPLLILDGAMKLGVIGPE